MLTIKVRRILMDTPAPTILELGACDGRYTNALIRACKEQPRIWSFEPDPRNIKKVAQSTPSFVKVVQAAVGNTTGKVPFYLASPQPNGEIGSSSISPFKDLSKAFEWCKCEGTVDVDCWRLDDFCEQNGIAYVDFIFMDIQGAERLMIQGAQRVLKSTRYLWTEFEGKTMNAEGTCYADSSSLERLLGLLPGWQTIEVAAGDALLINRQCEGNPHEPVDIIGG